jgi:hypothetical protein
MQLANPTDGWIPERMTVAHWQPLDQVKPPPSDRCAISHENGSNSQKQGKEIEKTNENKSKKATRRKAIWRKAKMKGKRKQKEEQTKRREGQRATDGCNDTADAVSSAASSRRVIGKGNRKKEREEKQRENPKRRKEELLPAVLELCEWLSKEGSVLEVERERC